MLNGKKRVPLIKKPELLDDILQETEELIKIFVTSIKMTVRQAHGPERSRRAEKKNKLNCGAERHHYSMFDVGRSMLDVQSVR